MSELSKYFKIALASVSGVLSWFFGNVDSLIYALLAFMIVDYFTGVAVAFTTKKLSSKIGARGILRKVMILVVVAIANTLDQYVLQTKMILRDVVIFFYIANEGISLLENVAELGLPVPKKVRTLLKHLHDHDDEDEMRNDEDEPSNNEDEDKK